MTYTLTVSHTDRVGDRVHESEEYPTFDAARADLSDYERTERLYVTFDGLPEADGQAGDFWRNGETVGYWAILRNA